MMEEKLNAETDYYDIIRQKHEKLVELLKVFWFEEVQAIDDAGKKYGVYRK